MSKKKEEALRKAALDGDDAALQTVIASGVNLEGPHPKDGQTALHYASANGRLTCMGILLKAGSNIEGRDKFGFTALHIAAIEGHLGVIKLLLEKGADYDLKNKDGKLPIALAPPQFQDDIRALIAKAATKS